MGGELGSVQEAQLPVGAVKSSAPMLPGAWEARPRGFFSREIKAHAAPTAVHETPMGPFPFPAPVDLREAKERQAGVMAISSGSGPAASPCSLAPCPCHLGGHIFLMV